jgi:hypothetical protein
MNTIVSSTSLTISPKDGAVSIIDIGGLEQQLEQQQQQQQQQHFEPTGQLLSKLKTKTLDINLSDAFAEATTPLPVPTNISLPSPSLINVTTEDSHLQVDVEPTKLDISQTPAI